MERPEETEMGDRDFQRDGDTEVDSESQGVRRVDREEEPFSKSQAGWHKGDRDGDQEKQPWRHLVEVGLRLMTPSLCASVFSSVKLG